VSILFENTEGPIPSSTYVDEFPTRKSAKDFIKRRLELTGYDPEDYTIIERE
jgi:hypothetical protein